MKRFFKVTALAILIGGSNFIGAESIAVIVPKKYLEERASVVFYFTDDNGQLSIGTFRLNEASEQITISQNDLQFKNADQIEHSSSVLDVTNLSDPCDHDIVFYINLDKNFQVVRAIVIKENFGSENPLSMVSVVMSDELNADDDSSFDDSDMFDDLGVDVDSKVLENESARSNNFINKRYTEFTIAWTLAKNAVKRNVNDLSLWFTKK